MQGSEAFGIGEARIYQTAGGSLGRHRAILLFFVRIPWVWDFNFLNQKKV